MTFSGVPSSNKRYIILAAETKGDAADYLETLEHDVIGGDYSSEFNEETLAECSYGYFNVSAMTSNTMVATNNLLDGLKAWYVLEYTLDNSGIIESCTEIWVNA